MHESLKLFHPLVGRWFEEKYGEPTDIQAKAWPEIAGSRNVLITAPTGSGKTLTAFLWSLNRLAAGEWETGRLNVLYVSPLKALNNDIQKNLLEPVNELKSYFQNAGENFPDIRVMTRSGDTPADERQKMTRKPPEILITTPESLNLILTSRNARNILRTLKAVILDEIHAIAGDKRGTQLITAVDRLVLVAGEFQRIANSATVKPLEKIAAFAAGFKIEGDLKNSVYKKREMSILSSGIRKNYDIHVKYPAEILEKFDEEPVWQSLAGDFKKIIKENRSTLLFANNRRFVEKLTRMINEGENEELSYSHHGSLSRELRLAVEEKLKAGKLKSIVATNSLELGIDIGELDRVVLIQTPFRISSAIQRIGRAGHGVGKTSPADIYPVFGKDFIYAAITARCVLDHDIEEMTPVDNPLDVLAQVILSMASVETWDIDELFNFIKSGYPYRNLTRIQYGLVLDMLFGKYADSRIRELTTRLYVDKIGNTVEAKEGTPYILYMSGGTIPDRGMYDMRIMDTKAKIGELDEEFVWERRLGETFAFGNQVWRIQRITHNDVEVTPEKTSINIIPFWKAEEINRDFHFSEKIGLFLEKLNGMLEDPALPAMLEREYLMDENSASRLADYLRLEKEIINTELPHRHHIVLENFSDPVNMADAKQVVIHTFWGGRVNKPFVIALSSIWEEKYGYALQYYADNDCIMLSLPHEFGENDLFQMINSGNIETHLRKKLESTGYFGARFRENAGRALLLPRQSFRRRMPLWLSRLRSKKLLDAVSRYADFPVMLETWRTLLKDDFDLESLKLVLDEIMDGKIKITSVTTPDASPFADNVVWRQTNKYMYEDDTPLGEKKSSLRSDLIKEIISSPHLRPAIPQDVINDLDKKLKRTAPGYAPDNTNELLSWIDEKVMIPHNEWLELLEAVKRDIPSEFDQMMSEVGNRIVVIKTSEKSVDFYILPENIDKISRLFGLETESLAFKNINGKPVEKSGIIRLVEQMRGRTANDYTPEEYGIADFVEDYLSYYSIVKRNFFETVFGSNSSFFDPAIESLAEEETLIIDKISENSPDDEMCTTENLERLLRITRKARQPAFTALPAECLRLFLAHYGRLTEKGETMGDLEDAIDSLAGFPAPANLWEEYIIPSRMKLYYTSWLDSLTQRSGMIWLGCGTKKITPVYREDMELYSESRAESDSENDEILGRLFRDARARYDYYGLADNSKLKTGELVRTLWQLVWNGLVTNDSFETFRNGILNDFKIEELSGGNIRELKRSFYRRKKTKQDTGSWFILKNEGPAELDPIEKEELVKDRIRVLFKRYGIIFRDILANEPEPLQWGRIQRTLRLMELSGEILTGYFFEGMPGIQFMSFEAFRLLQEGLPENAIYWMNAADPLSLCGIKTEALRNGLPRRNQTSLIVFRGSKPVVISGSTFRNIEIMVMPEDPALYEYLSFFKSILSRQFNPPAKIAIEKINGEPPENSPYLAVFKSLGFKSYYRSLELWKNY